MLCDTSSLLPIHREEPGPRRLLRLLDGLDGPAMSLTLTLSAGAGADQVLNAQDPPGLRATLATLLGTNAAAPAGLVLFWSSELAYAVRPPLAPAHPERRNGWRVEGLLDLLGSQHTLGVFLLRRGGYVVGIYSGDLLVASKAGTRFVKNRHRKGGQSQRRFDRIREKQVDELFDQACRVARERIEPYAASLAALFTGGDRRTVAAFLDQCPYLRDLPARVQGRFINTPEPRHDTLKLAYDLIWRSEWTELRPAT
ncbi:MAG: Vms1/Ankzf1 family peptidyl-tRNA hydrolase [Dehalococcoidia bacterium]